MALPTVFLKAKNVVSKGKAALKAKSAGEEATGTLVGMIKGVAVGILSTLALPIIVFVGIIFVAVIVFLLLIDSVPFVVFGIDLSDSGGSTTNNYCNQDPSKAEYAYEQIKGGLAIPHYRQLDERWANVRIWDGDHGRWTTIGGYGCASSSFAMVASYLLDQTIYPDDVSEKWGDTKPNTHNVWYGDFCPVSQMYGIECPTYTNNWDDVKAAVKSNQPVIVHYGAGSLFTKAGHWIVIRGMTSDGKYLVNDPSDNQGSYKANYINRHFTESEMQQGWSHWALLFKAKVCENVSGIDYLQWAMDIANDDSHGYSQCARTGPDYDCSSLVYYSLLNSGYSSEQLGGYAFTTYGMDTVLAGIGFTKHPYNEGELKAGDILWRSSHTGIYAGDGKVVQASSSREGNGICGQTGDQTGTEIWISDNNNNWTHYFRKDS